MVHHENTNPVKLIAQTWFCNRLLQIRKDEVRVMRCWFGRHVHHQSFFIPIYMLQRYMITHPFHAARGLDKPKPFM